MQMIKLRLKYAKLTVKITGIIISIAYNLLALAKKLQVNTSKNLEAIEIGIQEKIQA